MEMTKKKRHSKAEVSAKLQQAHSLMAQGKLQRDVASALGISVMTFHRWRKAQAEHGQPTLITSSHARELDYGSGRDMRERIAELQLENSRLRRLVTDLLLEKVKLQEASTSSNRMGELMGRATH
jgi:putative transposase